MRFLRSNTAVIITVGPFYDKTDGVTIETGLTITNERITLTADTDAGSAPTNILDNVTGATSGTANDLNYITGNDAGMMQLELAAADTNRVGRMFLSITDAANHVPVFHEFFVLPAVIYDWLTAGEAPLVPTTAGRKLDVSAGGEAGIDWANVGSPTTTVGLSGTTVKTATDVETDTADIQTRLPAALSSGNMKCDVLAISTDTAAADNCEAYFDGTGYTDVDNLSAIRSSTAQGGAGGTITLDASASAIDDFYNYCYLQITSGTGVGQARFITDYVGATKVATMNRNWATNPDNTSVFIIWPFDSVPGASAPTAADIWAYADRQLTALDEDVTTIDLNATAVGSVAGAVGSVTGAVGSVTGAVGSVTGAVGSVTGNVGGNVTGSIGSLAAQAKADVNAEVDSALDTAIPGSPTAGSVNDVIKDLDARLPAAGTISVLTAAAVNAEVVDALAVDTYAEPAQGAPPATTTIAVKMSYIYKAWRNKSTQTSTTYALYNDDAATVDHKSTVSDDATTFTKGEIASGP